MNPQAATVIAEQSQQALENPAVVHPTQTQAPAPSVNNFLMGNDSPLSSAEFFGDVSEEDATRRATVEEVV